MHWNISNMQDNQLRRYFCILMLFIWFHKETCCLLRCNGTTKNQTFALACNLNAYKAIPTLPVGVCDIHPSFPCSEPRSIPKRPKSFKSTGWMKTLNTFRLISCTVLIMLEFFFFPSPQSPTAFFYVMAASCTVDCTDQIRCNDMTLCCYGKQHVKLDWRRCLFMHSFVLLYVGMHLFIVWIAASANIRLVVSLYANKKSSTDSGGFPVSMCWH